MREARYTRYVGDGRMLRSHSTAMVPPALRGVAAEPAADVLLVCPGIVYRRDAIDWQHTGTPHQLDLWRVTSRAMSDGDMDEMIAIVLGALTPGLPVGQHQRSHPYTVSGRQVDVCHDGRWVEVGECGLADPGVLAAAGLGGASGLALGVGLDRLLMLAKRIPDIRLLRSADSDHPSRRPPGPEEPAGPGRSEGPGHNPDQRRRQRSARPHLLGAPPGNPARMVRMNQNGGLYAMERT